MTPRRFLSVIAAATIMAAVLAAVTWRVHAQSNPMMHNGGQATPDHQGMHGPAAQNGTPPVSGTSEDPRQVVSLPGPMQEHMLANMRDHLATLNTVIGDVAQAKFDTASKILEERLGMSSLPLHQAAAMAPFFPEPMQNAGTSMHHAASRLAIALQDASVAQTFDSMRDVNAALHEVTSACVSCHTQYRVR
jgi:hypothetical protein